TSDAAPGRSHLPYAHFRAASRRSTQLETSRYVAASFYPSRKTSVSAFLPVYCPRLQASLHSFVIPSTRWMPPDLLSEEFPGVFELLPLLPDTSKLDNLTTAGWVPINEAGDLLRWHNVNFGKH